MSSTLSWTLSTRLPCCFSIADPQLWSEIGKLSARIRQSRRRTRAEFQRRDAKRKMKAFSIRRAACRLGWKIVCRHGVFFAERSNDFKCPRMGNASPDAWASARWMPELSEDIRSIAVVPFSLESYERLGVLQSRQRALGW